MLKTSFNSFYSRDAIWHHRFGTTFFCNALLSDGTKPSPQLMSSYYQWGPVMILKEIGKIAITKICSKIKKNKLLLHLQGPMNYYTTTLICLICFHRSIIKIINQKNCVILASKMGASCFVIYPESVKSVKSYQIHNTWYSIKKISYLNLCPVHLMLLASNIRSMAPGPPQYSCHLAKGRVQHTMQCHTAFNTLRLRQHGHHFADDIFKCIFLNENIRILNKISLKFIHKGPINNYPTLVQIMAWDWPGNKPLSKPMMISLLTYICITQPQWVKLSRGHLMLWLEYSPEIEN